MIKKYVAGPKTTIEIKVGSRQSAVGSQKSNGIIRSRRELDYLPRRLKKSGGINFFDLAQLKNLTSGLFEDVEIYLDFPLTEDPLEILNSALAIAPGEWKNRFKKIERTDAEKYRFAVFINDSDEAQIISQSNPNLTSAGLKTNVSGINRFRVTGSQPGDDKFVFYESSSIGGLFPEIDTLFQKVTNLPSVDAAAVELALDGTKPINVFLNQAVFSVNGSANRPIGGDVGTVETFVQDFDIDVLWFQDSGTTLPSSTSRQECSEYKLETYLGSDQDVFDFRASYGDGETNKFLSWWRSKILDSYEESDTLSEAVQLAVDKLIEDFNAKAFKAYIPHHLAATVYDHRHTNPSEVILPQLFWYSGTPPDYQYPLDEGDFPGGIDTILDPPLAPTISELEEFVIDEDTVLNATSGGYFDDELLAAFEQNGQFFYVWARDAF